MIFDRSHLERAIAQRLCACSFDELRVLDRVLQGIEQGRASYGPLDITRDVRHWKREAAMELRDWLFYTAAHEVASDAFDREMRTEQFRAAITEGLDELHDATPIAVASKRTEELALCLCSHPQSVHEAHVSFCLISACRCAAYVGL